jgi:transposase
VRDARHLARLLHLGEIVAVAVPSIEQEAARDLVRAREDVRSDLMAARHRLSKLLLRQGIVYYQGKAWTGVHERWLRAQQFPLPGLQLAFDIAYDTMLVTLARRDRLDAAITMMAGDSMFTPGGDQTGVHARGIDVDRVRVGGRDWGLASPRRPLDRRISGPGSHRVLLGRVAVAGVDHQDRQQPRPTVVDRGGVASPPALPARGPAAAPPGPRYPCRA